MSTLALPQQTDRIGFRFPKWYSDYLSVGSRSGSFLTGNDAPRTHRLTYLQVDGSAIRSNEPQKPKQKKRQFPTLRKQAKPQPLSGSLPQLTIGRTAATEDFDLRLKGKQHLTVSGLTERYNSFATVPDTGTLTQRRNQQHASLLYSNIRCATRARLCDFNKLAPVTIPSVGDIRRNVKTLPAICGKKIG